MHVSKQQNSNTKQFGLFMRKIMNLEAPIEKEFLNRMTHEFKNPLTKIYSAAQLLYEMDSEEERRDLITLILNGSKKLIYLMNNFFEYSKNYDGLDKKEDDIITIINNVVSELDFFIGKKNHNISIIVPDQLKLKIDSFKMEVVIANLLNNAIKYTPPNGDIELKLEKCKTHIIISIKDNGIGFKKGDKSKLFRKFTVIKHNSRVNEDLYMEGTGLGLYLSKKIIEQHNGKIWAGSEGINKGSTFYIQLPLE